MTKAWQLTRGPGIVTLSRPGRARFDVAARCDLPVGLRKVRLAHNIRQDLWRELQGLRGFSPVVEVIETPERLRLRAGGHLDGPAPPGIAEQLAALLAHRATRSRWIAQCRKS